MAGKVKLQMIRRSSAALGLWASSFIGGCGANFVCYRSHGDSPRTLFEAPVHALLSPAIWQFGLFIVLIVVFAAGIFFVVPLLLRSAILVLLLRSTIGVAAGWAWMFAGRFITGMFS